MAQSRHYCKVVDWDVKPQQNQTKNKMLPGLLNKYVSCVMNNVVSYIEYRRAVTVILVAS